MRRLTPEERAASLERKRQQTRDWYRAHRDALLERKREWNRANKETVADRNWRQKFGLSVSEVQAILDRQGGSCAVCRNALTLLGRSAHVDHDHDTDQVRGVLCRACNLAIGQMKDSLGRLRAAAAYLDRHRPRLRLVK